MPSERAQGLSGSSELRESGLEGGDVSRFLRGGNRGRRVDVRFKKSEHRAEKFCERQRARLVLLKKAEQLDEELENAHVCFRRRVEKGHYRYVKRRRPDLQRGATGQTDQDSSPVSTPIAPTQ